jgi:hypothetical protein
MTPANALAGEWTAVWRVGSGTEAFSATVSDKANSVTATCGSTTLTGGTFTYDTGNQHILYKLPNVGNVTSEN